MVEQKEKSYTAALYLIIAVLSIFRVYYILHGPLDLSPDEAHYWEWTRRPALSYYSKGPLVPYLIYAGTGIFGDTVLGVRIFAVFFSALSSLVMFRLVNSMYTGAKAVVSGFAAAIVMQFIPLFATFGVVFTIDSPFIFFWTLSLYLTWKAVEKPDYKNWMLLGLSIGLGLLAKYSMALFFLCGLIFLAATDKRYLLKTIKPYLMATISLAVFSPVIAWNFANDWVTVKHTAGMAHVSEGLRLSAKDLAEFLGSQIGAVTPVMFFLMLYAAVRLLTVERDSAGLQNRFILSFFFPVLIFFLFKSVQGKVQANWAMTGYLTGLIAFSRYFFGGVHPLNRSMKYLLWTGICLTIAITAVSHYPSIVKIPPRLDPSARLRGWKPLGEKVSSLHAALQEKGHVFVFSDRYQISSELAFYMDGHPRTFCINLGRRMNQYDLWPDMDATAGKIRSEHKDDRPVEIHGIFVRSGKTGLPPEVKNSFDSCERELFPVYERDVLLQEYAIFTCYNFQGLQPVKPEKY